MQFAQRTNDSCSSIRLNMYYQLNTSDKAIDSTAICGLNYKTQTDNLNVN